MSVKGITLPKGLYDIIKIMSVRLIDGTTNRNLFVSDVANWISDERHNILPELIHIPCYLLNYHQMCSTQFNYQMFKKSAE